MVCACWGGGGAVLGVNVMPKEDAFVLAIAYAKAVGTLPLFG